MVVGDSSMGHEEKRNCSGIGSWYFEHPVRVCRGVEVRCACRVSCSWKCLRIVFRRVGVSSRFHESVEFVERLESLVPEIAPELPPEYRVLNRVEICVEYTKYRLPDGGLSLPKIVVAARVFEALRILTGTAVFLNQFKARPNLSINLSQRCDNPPC